MIRVLAHPEDFQGKRVRLIGFINLSFEGYALYAYREDFEQFRQEHSLWLDQSRCKCEVNHRYVIVEATINAENKGHLGGFPAALEAISRCGPWPSRQELQESTPR